MGEYNFVTNNFLGNVGGSNNSVTVNSDLLKLLTVLKEKSSQYPAEKQDEVRDYISMLEEETTSNKPNKSLIKTAIEGLRRIGGNKTFQDTVGKIALLAAETIIRQ